jgi:hypothetical protein
MVLVSRAVCQTDPTHSKGSSFNPLRSVDMVDQESSVVNVVILSYLSSSCQAKSEESAIDASSTFFAVLPDSFIHSLACLD